MKIELPIKIHNKFEIEVKEITTGEVIQKGYAENIILDRFFTTDVFFNEGVENSSSARMLSQIFYGRGTGTLNKTRTTLFSQIGVKDAINVEFIFSANAPSVLTRKIVIQPSEAVGEIITEVGIGARFLYTHALIKDSEGNPLVLGPKTDTQEITIFATKYYNFNLMNGISLYVSTPRSNLFDYIFGQINAYSFKKGQNGRFLCYSDYGGTTLLASADNATNAFIYDIANRKMSTQVIRFATDQSSGKVKSIKLRHQYDTLLMNVLTMTGGYNFDKRQIGLGNGTQTIFNLSPWDEARIDKVKTVYVDGNVSSGATWSASAITFATAPAAGTIIAVDYWVDYLPKDINHVLDVQVVFAMAEGSAN